MTTGSLELAALTAPVERRGAAVATAWILGALALTLGCPGVPFVLGPALFGVLHVAADYRYLMARRGLPKALFLGILSSSACLMALRGLEAALPAGLLWPRLEVAIGWGTALAALLLGSRGRGRLLRLGVLAPFALLGLAAVSTPLVARLLFAHAHNLVGVALFWLLFRPRRTAFALPLALTLGGAALLLYHAPSPLTSLAPAWGARMLADTTSALPAALRADVGVGLGLSYVFLQLVHYGIWLLFVPMADGGSGRGIGTRLRETLRELGPVVLGGTVLLALLVVGGSLLDVHRTRQLYLSVATFHGYLELAAGGYLLMRGEPLRQAARG